MARRSVQFSQAREDDVDAALSDDDVEDDTYDEVRNTKRKVRGLRDSDEVDFVGVVKEYQRKKGITMKSRDATFRRKKEAMFAAARKDAETVVKDGCAYMEETLQQIDEFRAQEMSDDQEQLEKLAQLWDQENETSSTWLSNYRTSFENLVRRRGEEIDSASVMLEAHSKDRRRSQREVCLDAKNYVLEGQKNKALAIDASAYIKHFKTLLLS